MHLFGKPAHVGFDHGQGEAAHDVDAAVGVAGLRRVFHVAAFHSNLVGAHHGVEDFLEGTLVVDRKHVGNHHGPGRVGLVLASVHNGQTELGKAASVRAVGQRHENGRKEGKGVRRGVVQAKPQREAHAAQTHSDQQILVLGPPSQVRQFAQEFHGGNLAAVLLVGQVEDILVGFAAQQPPRPDKVIEDLDFAGSAGNGLAEQIQDGNAEVDGFLHASL